MKKIADFMSIKRRRIIMLIILDIIVLALSSFFALVLRFDFKSIPQEFIDNINNYFIIDAIILFLTFILFKLYFSIWTYASITELINIAFACTSYIIIEFTYKFVFNINMPRSSYLIKLMLLIMLVKFHNYICNLVLLNIQVVVLIL